MVRGKPANSIYMEAKYMVLTEGAIKKKPLKCKRAPTCSRMI